MSEMRTANTAVEDAASVLFSTMMEKLMGPLSGLKVIELASIGPGPMAAMLLADMGATVLRVDRKTPAELGVPRPQKFDLLLRNRSSVRLDLKEPKSVELVLAMIEHADVMIEGFRPGVTERLGLGPDRCLEINPKLVYGRMTGWGQDGPLMNSVGHDLNYIALTGALHAIGRAGQPPSIPLNLVGDFGGGTLYLVMGILAALVERSHSAKGQVIDAAMVDGVASLMTQQHGTFLAGLATNERGTNATDSGAPFYEVYQCSDERWISIAAVEKKFYAEALRVLGLESLLENQWNREDWPESKRKIAAVVRQRSQDKWCQAFRGVDACFAPLLTLDNAHNDPHLRARQTYTEVNGIMQSAPAPRFSRTPNEKPSAYRDWDAGSAYEILGPWLKKTEIEDALKSGLLM